MVSGISGSNLAVSLRELDQPTPPAQHQAMAASVQGARESLRRSRTETVTISRAAVAMSHRAEKNGRPADGESGRPVDERGRKQG